MGQSYGRQLLTTPGAIVQVLADGVGVWKVGGATIDWSLVAAVGADTVTPDGYTVKAGQKYLRYGQVLTKVTSEPAQIITVNGTPGGGTFVLQGTRPDTGATSTTAPIPYNATAAQVQAALEAIFGAGNVPTTGSAGGPWTVTPGGALAGTTVPLIVANGAGLTGGTNPSVTVAASGGSASYGMFGPFDPTATDGRQTLTRGEAGILNTTVLENGIIAGLPTGPTNHPPLLQGGCLYKARILATTGAHSLAAGPTFAELEAVLTALSYAEN